MPRHLISDSYERINEITTLPIYYIVKQQPRKRNMNGSTESHDLLAHLHTPNFGADEESIVVLQRSL